MGYERGGLVQIALMARPSLWRAGLESLVEDAGWPRPVVHERWADLLAYPSTVAVQAVLIDADLAARATAADVADIRRVTGGAVVIAFVPTQCHARVAVAFRNGMDGCIAADAGIEIVLSTVRHAMLGERVFPGRFFEKLLEESEATGIRNTATESGEQRHAATVVHPSTGRRIDDLTPREREVLQQLTFGHTNKEVARRMGLAEATVKVYIRSLCRKLKVKNRTQAVATLSLDPGLAGPRSGG